MLVNIPAPWILWVCSYSLHSCRVLQCIYCWCSIKKHVSACDEIATRRNLEQQITVSGRSAVGDIFWLSFRERFGLSLHLAGSRKQWCWETVLLEHLAPYKYIYIVSNSGQIIWQLNFKKIETTRILLSINLNFGCNSYTNRYIYI